MFIRLMFTLQNQMSQTLTESQRSDETHAKELPVRRDAEDVVAKGTLKKAKTENTSLTTRVDGLSKDVTAQIDAQQAK